jgi:hypothetical protein
VKVTIWVATDKQGSRAERSVEIDDEDLEGMSEAERTAYIHDYLQEELWQLIEWGWEEEGT